MEQIIEEEYTILQKFKGKVTEIGRYPPDNNLPYTEISGFIFRILEAVEGPRR
jgi:hypothetical protein